MMLTRVVILEDHALVRECLATVLTQSGFDVVGQFSDGDAFLMAVRALAPDIALIDLMLDRTDRPAGLDGLSALRALPGLSPQTRAVVLSAVRTPHVVSDARAAGAAAYLYKLDADTKRLADVLHAVAKGESFIEAGPFEGIVHDPLSANSLTPREQQVLACLSTGADNMKIAAMLGITERTVRAHVSSLYRKLKRENRAELALLGREIDLHPIPPTAPVPNASM